MSTFYQSITVAHPASGETRQIDALVDTGAFFTTLPAQMLREMGIQPTDQRRFVLADGRPVDMSIAEAKVSVNGGQVTTIVAFGADDGPSLLGAYTLEGLTLVVDPLNERLVPNNMLTL